MANSTPNSWRPGFRGCLVLAFALTSCGRDKSQQTPVDSAARAPGIATGTELPLPRDTVGPGAINWTIADLQKRMQNVGIEAQSAGEVRQPFLGSPGARFTMPGAELQAYVYADAGALSRDIDVLDTVRVSPPTTMVEWRLPPHLIVSNNLALILLTRDLALRKKLADAVRPNLYRHDVSARPAEATNPRKE